MNKVLTKEVVETYGVQTVPWVRVLSRDVKANLDALITEIQAKLDLPLIVKPAHLGSSIGIEIAHTDVELKKGLLAASAMDTEIIIEPYLSGFIEYNASVRCIDGNIQVSKIERPIS
jgi:D-alanine-D-alanine ligase